MGYVYEIRRGARQAEMDDTVLPERQSKGGLLIVEIVQERRETALGHHVTLGA